MAKGKKGKIDPEKFGAALKAWSKKKKIPLTKIAERMHQHPNNLYAYTKTHYGRPNILPTMGRLVEIADILEISLDQLARGPFGEGLRDE